MEMRIVKILLCFLNMSEQDLNVTNLAVTLGEEKYVISRAFAAMEREGLLDRKDKRKPVLTVLGQRMAEMYSHKVAGVIGHLLNAGVSQTDAKQDAIAMAVYCTDATFSKLREQGITRKVKLGFHEGMTFDGGRLCRQYRNGKEPLTFLIYKEKQDAEDALSAWNDRFENPCVLQVQDAQGTICLRGLRRIKDFHFGYWDGTGWYSMEQNGDLLSFPAEYMQFVSIGKDEGRMLYGRIMLQVLKDEKEEHILFTTYIA